VLALRREKPSVPLDWSDRWMCALVGVVQADDRSISAELRLHSDPNGFDLGLRKWKRG
jgi:hypothetical protein